jgi:hypothetical protein
MWTGEKDGFWEGADMTWWKWACFWSNELTCDFGAAKFVLIGVSAIFIFFVLVSIYHIAYLSEYRRLYTPALRATVIMMTVFGGVALIPCSVLVCRIFVAHIACGVTNWVAQYIAA